MKYVFTSANSKAYPVFWYRVTNASLPNFSAYLDRWSDDLDLLRQNWLLSESSFITFARERGVAVHGVITGDPIDFHKRGWLTADSVEDDGSPRFHPFRLYPLHRILKWRAAFGLLDSEKLIGGQSVEEAAREWNCVADLAIILEPIYWPDIIGRMSMNTARPEDHRKELDRYREKALGLVKTLDPKEWREIHGGLRSDAGWMDRNNKLYVLLRLSKWDERKDLTGAISGALWMRHLAEVIRRGFEEVHNEEWLEEDRAFGLWHPAGRKRVFGSERPLDDPLRSKPYLAWTFGLFTGSSVRWYLEGETEYYAVLEILPEPSRMAVEIVNLRGNIESGRDNAALKLEDWLKEDLALRRFSMISFDRDVPANVKAIQRQVQQDNIVGMIAAHAPDFEFANFTVEELAEIAAGIDEAHGSSGGPVRNADWSGIVKGRAFEQKYRQVSERKPDGLKGEEWGRALAAYAMEHPRRSDNGTERPLWQQVRAALYGWISNYDAQKQRFTFDPQTFEQITRDAVSKAVTS